MEENIRARLTTLYKAYIVGGNQGLIRGMLMAREPKVIFVNQPSPRRMTIALARIEAAREGLKVKRVWNEKGEIIYEGDDLPLRSTGSDG